MGRFASSDESQSEEVGHPEEGLTPASPLPDEAAHGYGYFEGGAPKKFEEGSAAPKNFE